MIVSNSSLKNISHLHNQVCVHRSKKANRKELLQLLSVAVYQVEESQ